MCVGYAVDVARDDEPSARRRARCRSTSRSTGAGWSRSAAPNDRACSKISTIRPAARCGASGTANVHRALGCVGTITQGAVRDLDALERLGFHAFATSVSVAHGYGAFVGYGEPVTVAGSARSRPATCSSPICTACCASRRRSRSPSWSRPGREIDRLESEIFAECQSNDFSVERLEQARRSRCSRDGRTAGRNRHAMRGR